MLGTIFALGLLGAAPQDIDARRIDLQQDGGTTTCRFAALPELSLETGSGFRTGTWRAEATGTSGRGITMEALYDPNDDESARIGGIGFVLSRNGLDNAEIASAHLKLDDDGPTLPLLEAQDMGDRYVLGGDPKLIAPRLETAKEASLILLDAAGKSVRVLSWDISSARRAPALLRSAHWRCSDSRLM